MTSTTDTDRDEMGAQYDAHESRIAAQGRDTIPAWVNLDAIGIIWDDVQYRREAEATGRLLVEALARWAKSMLPVSDWPDLEIEGPVYEALKTYLGYDTIDYVIGLISEIHEMLEVRDNEEAYERWANDPKRRDVWEEPDSVGWFDLRLDPDEARGYVELYVKQQGGTVTWPEGGEK